MRKWFIFPIVVGMIATFFVGMSQATPVHELTTLAQLFPEDTPVFGVMRTDDGYMDILDGVLNQVNDNLGGVLGDVSAADLLDQATFIIAGQDYQSAIGTWLGDSVALAITDYGALTTMDTLTGRQAPHLPLVIAAEVEDRNALQAMLSDMMGDDIETEERGEYTLYTDTDAMIALGDHTLILGFDKQFVLEIISGDFAPLSEDEQYNAAIAALPKADYNLLITIDNTIIIQQTMETLTDPSVPLGFDLSTFINPEANDATIAMGLTIIDGRHLVIDAAVAFSDRALKAQQAIPGYVEQKATSLDLVTNIPASGGQILMIDNGFGPDTLAVFESLDAIGPVLEMLIDEMVETDMLGSIDPETRTITDLLDLSTINLGGLILNQVTPLYAGLTGLNLQHDVLKWMTGDYAFYLALIPVESDLGFSLDIAFITENVDDNASDTIIERLAEASDLYGASYTMQEIGSGRAIVMQDPIHTLFTLGPEPLPELAAKTNELDLVVGKNDALFAVGSRPGAAFALGPEEDNLMDDVAFTYAAENLFLENPTSIAYIGTGSFVEALPALNGLVADEDQIELAQFIFSQVESATITSTWPNKNTTVTRMTLTLPEEIAFSGEALFGTTSSSADAVPPASPATALIPEGIVEKYANVPTGTNALGFPVLGDPDAPIVVEEFGSFGCPHCKSFHDASSDQLLELAKRGRISFSYIPVAIGPIQNIDLANQAGVCAAEQDMFWPVHDMLFNWQDTIAAQSFEVAPIFASVEEMGLDMASFEACFDRNTTVKLLDKAWQEFRDAGATGTPAFRVNGELLPSGTDLFDFITRAI